MYCQGSSTSLPRPAAWIKAKVRSPSIAPIATPQLIPKQNSGVTFLLHRPPALLQPVGLCQPVALWTDPQVLPPAIADLPHRRPTGFANHRPLPFRHHCGITALKEASMDSTLHPCPKCRALGVAHPGEPPGHRTNFRNRCTAHPLNGKPHHLVLKGKGWGPPKRNATGLCGHPLTNAQGQLLPPLMSKEEFMALTRRNFDPGTMKPLVPRGESANHT